MPSHLLFAYSCLLPRRIHNIVDEMMNCEDIAINLLAASILKKAPLALDLSVDDWGHSYGGLSSSSNFSNERSICLSRLVDAFGGENLRYNVGHRRKNRGESVLADRSHAYIYGTFKKPIIPKESALSLIGKPHTWHSFSSSSITSMSLDECQFCDVQITGVWIYRLNGYVEFASTLGMRMCKWGSLLGKRRQCFMDVQIKLSFQTGILA